MRLRKSVLVGVVVLGLAIAFRVQRVGDAEMDPSLRPGDWVLLGPGRADIGDIYRLKDPADSGRRVLRRVLGLAGQELAVRDGVVVVSDYRLRYREMGRDAERMVLSEDNRWLVRRRPMPDLASFEAQVVDDGAVFLMADNRDLAIDSRWWGPVPKRKLGRELWLRVGPADAWRGRLSWGGRDGPWEVPLPGAMAPGEGPL